MHPWKEIIRGETKKEDTMRCFMCLENIPCSDGNTENLKDHITTVHFAECHVEKLAEMCGEAEKKEEKEGWSINDIIEEERERREAAEKRRAESGGLMGMLRRKLRKNVCPESDASSNADPENLQSDCFLCKEKYYLNSNVYNKHLGERHLMIFGLKEIRECGEEDEKQKLIPQPERPVPHDEPHGIHNTCDPL